MRLQIIAIASLMAVLAILTLGPIRELQRNFFAFGDLRAFYCSARTAAAGFDPYRAEPIGTCERELVGLRNSNFVLPAPLPGHAIAALELVAWLPFRTVAILWCAVLGATFLLFAIALARLTGWSTIYSFAASLPLGFMVPFPQGQIAPLAVLAIVLAALALRSKRDSCAAILVALATIEPHIGLPAVVALGIARPRARLSLLLALVCLAVIDYRTIGLWASIEYVTRVLPEHIASEARFDGQFSLTYALSWLGISTRAAITLGQLSYWLLVAGGIYAAVEIERKTTDTRFLLLIPSALSVVGGPFVHIEHILAALPLAVLLLTTADKLERQLCRAVLLLVAVPAFFVLREFNVDGMTMRFPMMRIESRLTSHLPLLAESDWAARTAPDVGHWCPFVAKSPSWLGLAAIALFVGWRLRRASNGALSSAREVNVGSDAPQTTVNVPSG
jgi:hypothetical protein